MTEESAHTENGRGRGRPAKLSHAVIIETAMSMPLEQISMQEVAATLRVSPQALYHYFKTKEDLLAAITDEIKASFPRIDPDAYDWRTYIRKQIAAYKEWISKAGDPKVLFPSHLGWMGVSGRINLPLLEHFDESVGVLVKAGFPPRDALTVSLILTTLTLRMYQPTSETTPADGNWAAFEQVLDDPKASSLLHLAAAVAASGPEDGTQIHDIAVELVLEGAAKLYGVE